MDTKYRVTKYRFYDLVFVIIALVLLSILALSNLVFAQTVEDDNFKVTWHTIQDKSNYKEYIIEIQNKDLNDADFDLRALVGNTETSFDFQLYEWKDILKPVMVETENCYSVYDENNSFYLYEQCETIKQVEYKNIAGWKKTAGNVDKLSKTGDYGVMLIPKYASKPKYDDEGTIITQNGIKTFKLILENFNPILYSGELAISDLLTGGYYHPMVESLLYNSAFIEDNATGYWFAKNNDLLDTYVDIVTTYYYSYDGVNSSSYSWFYDLNDNEDLHIGNQMGLNYTSPLELGNFVSFNGVNDYTQTDDEVVLEGTMDWTVSALVWTNNSATATYFLYGCDDPNSGCSGGDFDSFDLISNADRTVECGYRFFKTWGGAGNNYYAITDTSMPANQWTLITCSGNYNGTINIWFNTTEQALTMYEAGNKADLTIWLANGCLAYGDGEFNGCVAGTYHDFLIDEMFFVNDYFDYNKTKLLYDLYTSGIGYNFTPVGTYNSTAFNVSTPNSSRFMPIYSINGSGHINITAEGGIYDHVVSNHWYNVSNFTEPLNFTYRIELGVDSNIRELNITFNATGGNGTTNVTNVTTNTTWCEIYDNQCTDGKMHCLLAFFNDTEAGDIEEITPDGFDYNCTTFNLENPYYIFLLYFVSLGLMFIGVVGKVRGLALAGAFIGSIVSIGLIWFSLWIGLTATFLFIVITIMVAVI